MWVSVYITAIMHGMLVLFVVACSLSSLLGKLRPGRASACYLGASISVILSQFIKGECILTVVEKALRQRYMPQSVFHNSFLGHYLPFIPVWVYNSIGPLLLITGVGIQIAAYVNRYRTRDSVARGPAETTKS